MAIAFMFPGQGSQERGMGYELSRAFSSAREALEEVDEALGQSLTRLMFDGPQESLNLTENAQPAVMAVSMAVIRVLTQEGGWVIEEKAKFAAGHSLGEYTALCALGAFSLSDTARLVKRRGLEMQRAVAVGRGAMVALLGIERDRAQEIAEEAAQDQVCSVANDNAPGQVVLSGEREAIERAIEQARTLRIRSLSLPVSAPFHCRLMGEAALRMESVLRDQAITKPCVPLISNVTATAIWEPETIRALLIRQITQPVLWRQSMEFLKEREIETFVECGHGTVLTGLARKCTPTISTETLNTPWAIEKFLSR